MKNKGKLVIHFEYDSDDGVNVNSHVTNIEINTSEKRLVLESQLPSFALHLLPIAQNILARENNSLLIKKRLNNIEKLMSIPLEK